MAKVKFEVTSEVANAVAGLLKVAAAEAKVGQEAQKAAQQQTRASRDMESNIRRMQRAAESAQNRSVFRSGFQVRSGDLATSQMMRAIGGSGGGSSNPLLQQANDLYLRRMERARYLREQRQAAQTARVSAMIDQSRQVEAARVAESMRQAGLSFYAARDARNSRHAGDLASAAVFSMGSRGVPILGRGGEFHAGAVKHVSKQLSSLPPELAGKITDESFQSWVGQEEQRQARSAGARRTVMGGAVVAGTAGMAFLDAMDETRMTRADAMRQQQDTMAGLLGLGDNMANAQQLQKSMQQTAVAWGTTFEKVVDARYNIESLASNMDKGTQDQIFEQTMKLSRLTPGGDTNAISSALTKFLSIKGNELGNAQTAASKLLKTADIGGAEVGKLATLSPEIFSAAGQRYSFDEIAGGVAMVTRELGRNETAITGLKMVMARMRDAEMAGLVKPGQGLIQQMEQLKTVGSDAIRAVFQDEGAAAVGVLRKNVQQLQKDIAAIAGTDPNLVNLKVAQQAATPGFGTSQLIEGAKSEQANILANLDEAGRKRVLATEIAILGSKAEMPNAPEAFHRFSGMVLGGTIVEGMGLGRHSATFKRGANILEGNLRAEGKHTEADALGLTFGWETGSAFTGKDSRQKFTSELHANEFRSLVGQGYNLNRSQYLQYLTTSNTQGQDAGQQFLQQFKEAAKQMVDAANTQKDAAKANAKGVRQRNAQTE